MVSNTVFVSVGEGEGRVFIGPEIRAVARNSGFFKIWPEIGPNFWDNLSHRATISETLAFASLSVV